MTQKEYFTKLYEMGKAGAVTEDAITFLCSRKSLDENTDSFLRIALKNMEHEKNRQERLQGESIGFNLDDPASFMLYVEDVSRQVSSKWAETVGKIRLQQPKGSYTFSTTSEEYIALRNRLGAKYSLPNANDRLNSTQKQKYRDIKRYILRTLDKVAGLEMELISLDRG